MVAKKKAKKAPKKVAKKKVAKKKVAKKKAAPKKVAKKKVAKKKAAPKKVAKKKVVKKKAAPKKKRKPNAAFMRPRKPSSELAKVVGETPLPTTKVMQKIWHYIKQNKLQNPNNKRNIIADDTLKGLFGKKEVSMFEMVKIINKHLS